MGFAQCTRRGKHFGSTYHACLTTTMYHPYRPKHPAVSLPKRTSSYSSKIPIHLVVFRVTLIFLKFDGIIKGMLFEGIDDIKRTEASGNSKGILPAIQRITADKDELGNLTLGLLLWRGNHAVSCLELKKKLWHPLGYRRNSYCNTVLLVPIV